MKKLFDVPDSYKEHITKFDSNIYSWSMRSDRECKYKTTEKKAGVTV